MTNKERVERIRIGEAIFTENLLVGLINKQGDEWVEKRAVTEDELMKIVFWGIRKLCKEGSTQIKSKKHGIVKFSFEDGDVHG